MQHFWHERLSRDKSLIATGHRAFNLAYNEQLYEMQQETLDILLQTYDVDLADKRVLDVGSGLGFFVNYFLAKRVKHVTGLDIAPAGVEYLQATYPQSKFYCVDVGDVPALPVREQFDIVSAISVLYHIIEEAAFQQAMKNMCQAIAPGGYLIVSDKFSPFLQLTAGHVQFRTLAAYRTLFAQFDLHIVDVLPMYYFMNRTFVPYLMPPILGLGPVTRLLVNIDRHLRRGRVQFGAGLKILLARRGRP